MSLVPIPTNVGHIHEKVVDLYSRLQYAQRTPEWYEVRRDLITASEASSALRIKPFAGFKGCPREDLMLTKLNKPKHFCGMAMQHGIHYEDEACRFAMKILEKTHLEFGLIVHKEYPWLAASPDGITTDGFCVEIKCPLRRKIIPGVIPHHYMPQIQVQMEVCDIEETIFIQYKPAHMTDSGEPYADITFVKRDREWFAKHKETLQSFWEELNERRKFHIPDDGKEDENILEIDDSLYETFREYVREYSDDMISVSCIINDDLYSEEVHYEKQF